jgi:hypothetical protein
LVLYRKKVQNEKIMEKDGHIKYARNDDIARLLIKEGWIILDTSEETTPKQTERKKASRKQK